MFSFEKHNYSVGLDISDFVIRAMQLEKKHGAIEIKALSLVGLDKNIISGGEIKNEEKVINALKELFSKPRYGHFSSREVVMCLPETKTFLKLVEISNEGRDYDLIREEIEKNIPYAIEELYIDWQIIESSPDIKRILVGAVPKVTADQYLTVLKKSGLDALAMEIEPASICRAILSEEGLINKKDKRGKNYIIMDIGATRTSLSFYSKNTILFTVSVPISGNQISQAIAENLNLTEKQAEKAKIICGLDELGASGTIKNIITEKMDILSSRVKEAIYFYEENYPDRGKIDEIMLCGGGANIQDIDKIIGEKLGLETVLANIFLNIKEGDKFVSLFSESHLLPLEIKKSLNVSKGVKQSNTLSYASVMGLALRDIFLSDKKIKR